MTAPLTSRKAAPWACVWAACAALCLVAGCGADPEPAASADTSATGADADATNATNADATAPTGDADATNADATTSADTDTPTACEATRVTALRGKVFDAAGQPLPGARPQACVTIDGGELICLRPPETNADGVFLQSIPFEAECVRRLAMRITHPPSTRATTYCPATLPVDTSVLAFSEPFALHDTLPPTDLPAEGDPSSARAVTFSDGLTLTVTPDQLRFAFGGYADLRAAPISPDAAGLCFLDPARPVDALWALYPEADVQSPSGGAPLRIPNTPGYSPGEAVTLWTLGGLDCTLNDGVHIPEGVWHPYGQARVSDDGQWVESDPGAGIPCLTWLGISR